MKPVVRPGIEGNRRSQPEKGTGCVFQPLDPAMWNGHPLTQTRRTKLLASEQTIEHGAARNPEVVFKKEPHVLKDALLAARVQIKNDVFKGK